MPSLPVRPARGLATRAEVADTVVLTAFTSFAAGTIHAVVAPEHFREDLLFGLFFCGAALAQWAWGVAVLLRPRDRTLLLAGAAGNVAIVVLWAVTRTAGLPIGPEHWTPEPVGAIDVLACLDELLLAAVALGVLAAPGGPETRSPALLRVVRGAAIAVLVGSFVALMSGGGHPG